ncbi:MAG: SusC/RagA family TonB-linked outer membrane protein [Cyclobacteriaceae bacterium]|nr:SusC/RagA family TonB-linked outer membrane protein [Cyclobacteriaceae bacterium]
MSKLLRILCTAAYVLCAVFAYSQGTMISGRVTAADDGLPLPGVNVSVKGTTIGVVTDTNGRYELQVERTDAVLVFSFIGFISEEISIGGRSSIDVSMNQDVTQLSEIVITGVAEGTSTRKLGFAIGKVGENLLSEVPAVDAGNALRGKVSGVQIIQRSGTPGTAASIRLRGATTISNAVNQEPLIIIDGVITPPGSSSLADINMNDVESIEVVKGAAGAALYGSLAGNGVVQIITKRGSSSGRATTFTFRTEAGVSQMQRFMKINQSHNYQLDGNGQIILDGSGNPLNDASSINDNPWPVSYNHQKELFENRGFFSNYLSMATNTGNTGYFASVDQLSQGGVIEGLPSFDRTNLRLNVDHRISDKFNVAISTLYSSSSGPAVASEGDQVGIVYEVLRLSPSANIRDVNFDGQPFITTNIGKVFNIGRNSNNPLYRAYNDKFTVERDRILGNFSGRYEITSWWKVDGQLSYDRSTRNRNRFRDKKFLNINNSSTANPYNNSFIFKENVLNTAKVYSLTSIFSKSVGKLGSSLSLRYQAEDYGYEELEVSSVSNIVVDGIDQTTNIPTDAIRSFSMTEIFRAQNLFANLRLDYDSKYILDGLIRRDESSLFGANNRDRTFYRISGAYRLTEDIVIPGVQEMKLRASLGTSGQRPPFSAQYERVPLINGSYELGTGTKGNPDLKPSTIREFETGINVDFLKHFTFEFTYAHTNADDQILLVPLSATTGYANQWQNAGSIESKTFEWSLNSKLINNQKVKWDLGIVGSRTRSIVTKLNRSEFGYEGGGVGSGSFFRIKEGETIGAIYGGVMASKLSELTVDENGFVNNLESISNRPLTDFVVNRDGFVILNGTEFTTAERPYNLVDPTNGGRVERKIGDSTPDFIFGINSTISYNNLSLFVLVDGQIGGDIANVNKQNMMFNDIAHEVDQSSYPEGQRKHSEYFSVLSNSGAAPNQYFIEDGTFATLREVSLSYSFSSEQLTKLGKVGNLFTNARLSLIGRNLVTFTKYSGWTPEVAATGGADGVNFNPFNFRADFGAVPIFRTYAVSLQVRF